jgi:DNA repair photolyase
MDAVRWESLQLIDAPAEGLSPALFAQHAVVRRYDTPQFRGMTFYEVQARSILNKVPEASRMPFRWTVNPYRGCSHACVYCFARKTHTYLDLDSGHDFDSRVVVKVNAPELLRRELGAATWRGEHVAMGTNVDCYQRAEGRYQLMRGILAALRDAANPFSILTKGTLILRDLDLLQQAAQVTSVGANVSVGFLDRDAWRGAEPGTPPPEARLAACRTLRDAGIDCGVLMAPVLPFLTDSPQELERTVRAIAEAGAQHVSPIVLHLRPGAREWYLSWLGVHHPALVPRYRELYARGSYPPRHYSDQVTRQVRDLAERYGITRRPARATRGDDFERRPAEPSPAKQRPARRPDSGQLTLM